ncbi:putative NLR Family CARD Domain Containing protein [Blattamonas nauphoetae]|uniref:NLR Family CARD Domain Containing protein n=1 Tax=Blattamonas nauphoetae TaxID=2049346 RepID=A0ABQ9Y3C3_9EUKA|nr:putative NLR Family CARD Domain Containing protein [Blattamonas nauphoetae]
MIPSSPAKSSGKNGSAQEETVDFGEDFHYHPNTKSYSLELRWKSLSVANQLALGSTLLATRLNLTTVNLAHTDFTPRGMQQLASVLSVSTTITNLDIGHNKLGEEGAVAIGKALASNITLQHLNLEWNDIQDTGLKSIIDALVENKDSNLHSLDIHSNKIGPAGGKFLADYLATDPSLRDINARFNPIGDEGARAILRSILYNRTLHTVDLTRCDIGDDCLAGYATKQFFQEVPSPTTQTGKTISPSLHLLHLRLDQNRIGADGLRDLMSGLHNLMKGQKKGLLSTLGGDRHSADQNPSSLSISQNNTIALNGHIPALEGIRAMVDYFCDPCCGFEKIEMSGCGLGDAGCDVFVKLFAGNRTVKEVDIGRNRLTNLSCHNIVDALAGNHSLVSLDLRANEFTEVSFAELIETVEKTPTLREIDLRGNPIRVDEEVQALLERYPRAAERIHLKEKANDHAASGQMTFSSKGTLYSSAIAKPAPKKKMTASTPVLPTVVKNSEPQETASAAPAKTVTRNPKTQKKGKPTALSWIKSNKE